MDGFARTDLFLRHFTREQPVKYVASTRSGAQRTRHDVDFDADVR